MFKVKQEYHFRFVVIKGVDIKLQSVVLKGLSIQ